MTPFPGCQRGDGTGNRAYLSDREEPFGAHDLWIAATAIAHGLGVATRNTSHFDRVPGLRVV